MSQVYLGRVQDGVIVLDAGSPELAPGTRVRVEAIAVDEELQDLSRRLLSIAGTAEGLPSDLAEQHDHYIHGTPKQ